MEFVKFFFDNIIIIKDFLWIVFTLIATIVAVLTYVRARFTVLQPLRSEVVKRQIEEMIELLNFLNTDNLYERIDYDNILLGNFELKMSELGFSDDKSTIFLKKFEEMFVGSYITQETFDKNRYYHAHPYFDPNKIKEKKEKTDYELLQEGIVKLHGIKITKKHNDYMKEFKKYLESPIIPINIKMKLEEIMRDINKNITIIIPLIIKNVIITFHKKQIDSINFIGITSIFYEQMSKHDEQIQLLKKEIRDYLKIDLKW